MTTHVNVQHARDLDEIGEFVTTLLATPPSRLTACAEWTAHELVAHLAAGAAEEADLIEAHNRGDAERPTRALLWGRREPSAPIDVHADDDQRELLTVLF